MALQPTAGTVWSFTTAGSPGSRARALPSLPSPTPDPGPSPELPPPRRLRIPIQIRRPRRPTPAPDADPRLRRRRPHRAVTRPAPAPPPAPLPTPRPDDGGRSAAPKGPPCDSRLRSRDGRSISPRRTTASTWCTSTRIPRRGAPPIFLGASPVNGGASRRRRVLRRPAHGERLWASSCEGWRRRPYMIAIFARSSYGAGFPLAKVVNVRVEPSAMLALDAPGADADGHAAVSWSGDGRRISARLRRRHRPRPRLCVSARHRRGAAVSRAAPVNVSRPDVAAYGGAQFGNRGST